MTILSIPKPISALVSDRVQQLRSGRYSAHIGTGSISGIVKEDGIPVSRRVMLYERHSGALINTTYSKENGRYKFANINKYLKYYIVSIDEYNDGVDCPAVIKDRVSGNYDQEVLG